MTDFLTVNVNDHTEKKNGLTYLSWAWAWAEVLKADPDASWGLVEYADAQGLFQPCMYLPDGTALVKVAVTIGGKTRTSVLPVMNPRNQAIKEPDAFQVNTAIMRCLTKAIAMFGLGLYIYAGEDLPEGETAPKPARVTPTTKAPEPPLPVYVGPVTGIVGSDPNHPAARPTPKPPMPTPEELERYNRGMAMARRLGVDVSLYPLDPDTTGPELLATMQRLGAAIKNQEAAQTTLPV